MKNHVTPRNFAIVSAIYILYCEFSWRFFTVGATCWPLTYFMMFSNAIDGVSGTEFPNNNKSVINWL